MEQFNEENINKKASNPDANSVIIDPAKIDNEVLKRLIGEIDFEKDNRIHSYNRTHNRHNRGR